MKASGRPDGQTPGGTPPEPGRLESEIKSAARQLGFDAVGICALQPIERDALAEWLSAGHHGTMEYMERQSHKRKEPQRIVPGATKAVVVLRNYFQGDQAKGGRSPRIARYAWGEDYHRVVGDALDRLRDRLIEMGSSPQATRSYVDAGPVPERELAQRAGLGWIAKNTMLIDPRLGSFTFIGVLFTDLDTQPDVPFEMDRCGSCRLCLDACPTDAFPSERILDANRCISYLTIELRGPFEPGPGALIDDWLFGCDVCQDVCPWNVKFGARTSEKRFHLRDALAHADLDSLTAITSDVFDRTFADTALERAGAKGLARNAQQIRDNRRVAT